MGVLGFFSGGGGGGGAVVVAVMVVLLSRGRYCTGLQVMCRVRAGGKTTGSRTVTPAGRLSTASVTRATLWHPIVLARTLALFACPVTTNVPELLVKVKGRSRPVISPNILFLLPAAISSSGHHSPLIIL